MFTIYPWRKARQKDRLQICLKTDYNDASSLAHISCSVPRISIPKDWSAILIFQMRNPSILMSASYWSGAIRKKFWQTSTQKVTYALLIRQLLSITLNMEVMIHMSCPSVFYASLSALLHTSASWPICHVMNSLWNVSKPCTMPDETLNPHSGNWNIPLGWVISMHINLNTWSRKYGQGYLRIT